MIRIMLKTDITRRMTRFNMEVSMMRSMSSLITSMMERIKSLLAKRGRLLLITATTVALLSLASRRRTTRIATAAPKSRLLLTRRMAIRALRSMTTRSPRSTRASRQLTTTATTKTTRSTTAPRASNPRLPVLVLTATARGSRPAYLRSSRAAIPQIQQKSAQLRDVEAVELPY